ncbi:ABC-2 type transport system ATP-binding protein OS=Streptomyces albaduncus OX=68172 GN=FHS32_003440 PE=4 SV=1 [Streptomyces griseoloalbus]
MRPDSGTSRLVGARHRPPPRAGLRILAYPAESSALDELTVLPAARPPAGAGLDAARPAPNGTCSTTGSPPSTSRAGKLSVGRAGRRPRRRAGGGAPAARADEPTTGMRPRARRAVVILAPRRRPAPRSCWSPTTHRGLTVSTWSPRLDAAGLACDTRRPPGRRRGGTTVLAEAAPLARPEWPRCATAASAAVALRQRRPARRRHRHRWRRAASTTSTLPHQPGGRDPALGGAVRQGLVKARHHGPCHPYGTGRLRSGSGRISERRGAARRECGHPPAPCRPAS